MTMNKKTGQDDDVSAAGIDADRQSLSSPLETISN